MVQFLVISLPKSSALQFCSGSMATQQGLHRVNPKYGKPERTLTLRPVVMMTLQLLQEQDAHKLATQLH